MQQEIKYLARTAPVNLYQVLIDSLEPRPDITCSQWADNNRLLSGKFAAEPGPWRTERAPWTREVMDCFSDGVTERIDCMFGSQLAKSEMMLNVIGYFIDCDPCPILWTLPDLNMARSFSRDRLAPMLSDTPSLAAKVAPAKSRDAANTTLQKEFPGGQLTIVGYNSPAQLSGRPIRVLLCDEVDRAQATSEGDPVDLALRRTSNFWNRKIGTFSSPSDKEHSRIYPAYLAGDQREWYVACPDCGFEQTLKWSNVVWDKLCGPDGKPIQGPDGLAVHQTHTAMYACSECGALWDEPARVQAVLSGRWIAKRPFEGRASFSISGLYTVFGMRSLATMAAEFVEAKKQLPKLQVFRYHGA